MKATFVVPYTTQPVLPSQDDDAELHLAYTGADGKRHGGFVCLSYVPAPTCIVLVDSTPEVIDALSNMDDCVFMEVIDAKTP